MPRSARLVDDEGIDGNAGFEDGECLKVKLDPNGFPQVSIETYMQKMMKRLEVIRTMPLDESKIPELTEKQLDRIKAFELRAQMRTEQGRPV